MKKYLTEVESRLISLPGPARPYQWLAESYIGGGQSKLRYLNLKIPLVRNEFKKGFSFSQFSVKEQWKIWDFIWQNSQIFEVMLLSSYWVSSRPNEEMLLHSRMLLKWLNRVDNWAHSDELSSHYSKLLERNPRLFLPTFKKWNRSKKPWFKRQSMVGLFFYSRLRKRKPSAQVALKFVERHIRDDHYYVQKAVGWTLRECWNVYPQVTFAFLKKHAKEIPTGGWTAATEKLSSKDKMVLLRLRKSKS
jgi:3-methyladenine DNA glycosylase AlkD